MSFGIPELVVILAIVLLLFGTKKLKSVGSDLGSAIKGFKKAMNNDEDTPALKTDEPDASTPKTSADKVEKVSDSTKD